MVNFNAPRFQTQLALALICTSLFLCEAFIPSVVVSWITVVGQGGTILRSRDAGISWKYQESGTREDLYDVYFSSARDGFVVGSNATFISTTDAGLQWTSSSVGYNSVANFSFFGVHYFAPTQIVFIVGEQGIILTNSGSWTLGQLPAACFAPDATSCAASPNVSATSGSSNLLKVRFFDSLNGVLVGDTPNIFITGDGGLTFTVVSPVSASLYPRVAFTALGQDQVPAILPEIRLGRT